MVETPATRRSAGWLLSLTIVVAPLLAGCLGQPPPPPPPSDTGTTDPGNQTAPPTDPPLPPPLPPYRDYSLARDVLVPGSGYEWMDLAREGRVGTLVDAAISADGSLVALGFESGDAEVWTTNGSLVAALAINGSDPSNCGGSRGTIRFVGNDQVLVLFNDCVRIFRFDGQVTFEIAKNNAVVWYPNVLISKDGRRIAAEDNYSQVLVVDLVSSEQFTVPINYGAISQFALSPDGRFVITVDGSTHFYRLDNGSSAGTLIATFDRIGHLAFSDDLHFVFQDKEIGQGNQVFALARYNVSEDAVTMESWSCDRQEGSLVTPMCPPHDSNFDAAGAGNRVAWVSHLRARWQEEDSLGHIRGNETYAYSVTFFDWGAPNATRGFQVGPSSTYAVPPYPDRDWNHEAVVRVFVMPDGSAFAIGKIGGYGYHIQLTHAASDAVAPSVIENYV